MNYEKSPVTERGAGSVWIGYVNDGRHFCSWTTTESGMHACCPCGCVLPLVEGPGLYRLEVEVRG